MSPDRVQALAAGATVVTPNRRLVLFIKREYDAAQSASGNTVWPSADALPYGAFLERTWQELAMAGNGAMLPMLPMLLSPLQEIALWETVIESSRQAGQLLNPTAAARHAREAWLTQHAFAMDHPRHRAAWETLNEDAAAYGEWRRACAERLSAARWIDSAQLPGAIVDAIAAGARPRVRRILRAGYETYSPQQQRLCDALEATGCASEDMPGAGIITAPGATRIACDDADAELTHVASCVRALLDGEHADNGTPRLRIGVVVPDLAARRSAVMRIFDDALEPLRVVTPGAAAPRLFESSLGLPLSSYPIVFIGFLALRLAGGEVSLKEAGAVLRSPHIGGGGGAGAGGGAQNELAARALADATLRQRRRDPVTPGALLLAAQAHAPQLAALLEAWIPKARAARALRQPPSAWSTTFLALLKGLGWPGARALDSAEFQTFEKFREVVSSLSALDPLRARLTLADALGALRRIAADTVFQPEGFDAPVQILGTLESTGLTFDALFVTGLAGDAWPAAPRANPFLPAALQRALNVPHASAAWELDFARRMTQAWCRAAPQVTFTWPRRDGERELRMSPLLDSVPDGGENAAAAPLLRDALYVARAFETLADWQAPPLAAGVHVAGGAALFQNQAACPFRAFALHHLGAAGLEDGADGLDARERGSLTHQALSALWQDLGSHARLLALSAAELEQKAATAAQAAVAALSRTRPDLMSEAFAALECERLKALLLRLADLEKSRAPFEVVAREQPRALQIAGVQVNARLDRVDRLPDGSEIILDYKTGKANATSWLGDRPDEPQLPLYAVSSPSGSDIGGIAFVQLRARAIAFKGVTRDDAVLPDVAALAASKPFAAQYADWPALLQSWRGVLEQLARDYLAGRAEVAPKDVRKTCEYCELGALCRVRELTANTPPPDGDDADNGEAA